METHWFKAGARIGSEPRSEHATFLLLPWPLRVRQSDFRPVEGSVRNRSKEQKDVLSERFIRRVFSQVMNGLREVHSNRLLHLDVKPANVYLRMDGTPILLDFGAARQTLQRDISKTYPMYTPGFAAPELYKRDAALGPWTAVYSVGACIYACKSGLPPQ